MNLKCSKCGSENLEVYIAWTDCAGLVDENEKECTCLVSLDCNDCKEVNNIIALKSPFEVGQESYVFLKR